MWFRLLVQQQLIELYRRHYGSEMRDIRRESASASRGSTSDSFQISALQFLSHDSTPSQTFSRKESAFRLEVILNALRPVDREIIQLRHLEELSTAEAAVALNITPEATRKRYVRAMRTLRDQMDENGWMED